MHSRIPLLERQTEPMATFVFQVKAGVAHRAITAERQVHKVGGALDLLGKFAVLKAADQMTVAVRPVVDVQEVIVGLNAKAVVNKNTMNKRQSYYGAQSHSRLHSRGLDCKNKRLHSICHVHPKQ